jgi:hypothetical protein
VLPVPTSRQVQRLGSPFALQASPKAGASRIGPGRPGPAGSWPHSESKPTFNFQRTLGRGVGSPIGTFKLSRAAASLKPDSERVSKVKAGLPQCYRRRLSGRRADAVTNKLRRGFAVPRWYIWGRIGAAGARNMDEPEAESDLRSVRRS